IAQRPIVEWHGRTVTARDGGSGVPRRRSAHAADRRREPTFVGGAGAGMPHTMRPIDLYRPGGAPMKIRTATVAAATLLAVPTFAATAAAEDTYSSYAELAANETEGVDYQRSTRSGDTDVAHIAIHGGGIERPTTELADHAAELGGHAFATFEGIKPSGNSVLHITSTNFDEPRTVEVVENSDYTISWHGAAGDEAKTYVGGLDTELRDAVRDELREEGFDVPSEVPDHLAGENPDNIANRNDRGKGVQLELTRGQRDLLMPNGTPVEAMDDYLAAVERAVSNR